MTIDIEKLAKENGFIPTVYADGECYADIETLKQFAEAYAAKVLEDKEREIAELKEQLSILKPHPLCDTSCLLSCSMEANYAEKKYLENKQLQAHINDLREALEGLVDFNLASGIPCDKAEQVLSKTPAQSLQEHDNELIEKCAKVCEENALGVMAIYIRALKVTND